MPEELAVSPGFCLETGDDSNICKGGDTVGENGKIEYKMEIPIFHR